MAKLTPARSVIYTALIFFTSSVLASCFLLGIRDRTFLLQKGTYAGKYYEIKRFNSGCCGCLSFYYNVYDNSSKNKTWQAQFVYEVNCGFGEPTRFNFHHHTSGAPTTEGYIVVNDSTYETPLSELDKMLMVKLDSITATVRTQAKYRFTDLKGWRKGRAAEEGHPFIITK